LKKFLLSSLSLALVLAGGTAFAATVSANATASIVANISIAKVNDLQFGNIVAGVGATTVSLSTAGVRSGDGNPVLGGTVTAASFTVTGDGTSTYAITLPTTTTLTRAAGAETMTVTGFGSNPSGTGILTAGTQNLLVGATLNVGAGQVAGVYSGTFDVSVAYN
jgi:hypothetical protein